MNLSSRILLFFLCLSVLQSRAQTCSDLGQNPGTAFPVCGTNTFAQSTVALCGNRTVPGGSCTANLTDRNPYWYKFTCFASGTLGFLITPNTLADDYDWQLFDITNRNPEEIYTNASLIVGSNWSGEGGLTGASSAGTSLLICDGEGKPLFSKMPNLIKDHQYLLLISHFTNTQSGYKLSFGGGTASITDTKVPKLEKAEADCEGIEVTVKLNKKMKCNSLAANGSDFTISPAIATVIGARGINCSNGFDMDSIVLTLSNALPPGNYTVSTKDGSDANTLLDACDSRIAGGETAAFTVVAVPPTPMDNLKTPGCAPVTLELVFSKLIKCNSIASNGSDFVVTGPAGVTVTGATGVCNTSGRTSTITVRLNAPIEKGGTYQIRLVNGSDGNTLIDQCGQQTPAGSAITFTLKDTVSAAFTYQVFLSCKSDAVELAHDGRNGVNLWAWTLDDGRTSNLQNPVFVYTKFGSKKIKLAVSNGVCRDTAEATVVLDNELKAVFTYPTIVCPGDAAMFIDKSVGQVTSWNWNFGNGFSSTSKEPGAQSYLTPTNTREVKYRASLIVGNAAGCFDTSVVNLKAVSSCYIAVPTAFSPNNDGINDQLYPLNAFKASDLKFKVYNRYGQLVFETNEWSKGWDGFLNGKPQPAGSYVWTLGYTDGDTGKKVYYKGNTVLIR
jgi:gliding motility-associated-like protein